MEVCVHPDALIAPLSLRQVFQRVTQSVAAFCREKMISARKAVGVMLRLERASARIDVLMRRFRRGELAWRLRAARVAPDAPVARGERKPALGLPNGFGWLGEELPMTAIYYGPALTIAMQDAEMQALMRATPEVARIMRPIFRMLALDEAVLLVPEGCPVPEPVVAVVSMVAAAATATAEDEPVIWPWSNLVVDEFDALEGYDADGVLDIVLGSSEPK